MRNAWIVLGLTGCTPIYNAQFEDRANELEEFRTDFLSEEDDTALLASGGNRVFWVATKRPEDQQFMHSMIPGDPASERTYSLNLQELDSYRFSEEWIAQCSFSSARAFSVNDPAQMTPLEPGKGASDCAVDGNSVWVIASDGSPMDSSALFEWTPGTELPETGGPSINLVQAGIAGTVAGFGVIGTRVVAVEQDGDLYTLDTNSKIATWLHNDEPVVGSVFFDERGALYETQNGARYIEFDDTDDPPDTSFDAMVRDGGYHLSFKHGDIQQPSGNGEFVIHERHIIYRGQRGMFAYGLDTRNVIDLLLDRGEGIDLEIAYHQPAVTKGGHLFVFGTDSFGIGLRGPVFQVDLEGRLR